jgi:hypothetical protein
LNNDHSILVFQLGLFYLFVSWVEEGGRTILS